MDKGTINDSGTELTQNVQNNHYSPLYISGE